MTDINDQLSSKKIEEDVEEEFNNKFAPEELYESNIHKEDAFFPPDLNESANSSTRGLNSEDRKCESWDR